VKSSPKTSAALEQALGSRSKVAVLRSLFHSKLGHSGSALSRQTGIALFAVQKALATLEGIGLVDVERGRVENRYRLNTQHYLVANGLGALFDGERQMSQALARELGGLLEGKVISAGLFGSFARGGARAGSDIDLFVAVKTLKDKELVSELLSDAQHDLARRYGWPVQAVIFERQRLIRGLRKGQTLLDQVAPDWQHITGLTPRELRLSLDAVKPVRSSS
jgi:predicted nucleotidyltransferase